MGMQKLTYRVPDWQITILKMVSCSCFYGAFLMLAMFSALLRYEHDLNNLKDCWTLIICHECKAEKKTVSIHFIIANRFRICMREFCNSCEYDTVDACTINGYKMV